MKLFLDFHPLVIGVLQTPMDRWPARPRVWECSRTWTHRRHRREMLARDMQSRRCEGCDGWPAGPAPGEILRHAVRVVIATRTGIHSRGMGGLLPNFRLATPRARLAVAHRAGNARPVCPPKGTDYRCCRVGGLAGRIGPCRRGGSVREGGQQARPINGAAGGWFRRGGLPGHPTTRSERAGSRNATASPQAQTRL